MILGIAGKKRAGKNTIADIIMYYVNSSNTKHTYQNYAFADSLKDAVYELVKDYFLDDEKESPNIAGIANSNGVVYTNRQLLQLVGTKLREIDPDIFVKSLGKAIKDAPDSVIITDVRYPNEAEYIKRKGGLLIRVNRPGEHTDLHESETALDNYKDWDYVIENDSDIPALSEKVIKMISDLHL